jgi:transcriptional regulator with XRE-family HTH domain
MKSLNEKLAELTPERRFAIEQRGEELIQEYMTLQELRKALDLTQTDIAEAMDIEQNHVSRLEKRQDMRLSTLKEYVEALGGSLNIIVDIPGKSPISISGIVGLTSYQSQPYHSI